MPVVIQPRKLAEAFSRNEKLAMLNLVSAPGQAQACTLKHRCSQHHDSSSYVDAECSCMLGRSAK